MRVPRPQPWGLWLLLVLLPRTLRADGHRSLQYRLTAVSSPARGTPAFWATGWLGPQQYLRYNSLRGQAEPFGAWIWESQLPWYWEKETTDLRGKQALFLEALAALAALQKGSYILQGLLGCEMGPDNATVPVASFALNGEEFMKFDVKAGAWDGDWPEAREIGQRWRQHEDAVWQERHFLMSSCPQRLLGHLQTGRGNLEWKDPPATSLVPVVGIVVGLLLLLAAAAGAAVLWWRMRRGLPAPWILLRGDDLGALLSTGPAKDADS
uniref:Fc of IgG receptor and transporter n=1 Tax=Pipistrellus kuhlii TaxID=59472 RepID=A0A7J7RC57_PIPKU|nr:Fc fragment of IgG receptor and transporter [Pipistrellus kuhlii]